MKRLVRMIDSCSTCDHSNNNSKDFGVDQWKCNRNGKHIVDIYVIADHCELPDGRREED